MNTNDFFTKLDQLFEQGNQEKTEAFLLDHIATTELEQGENAVDLLPAINELACFYRGISRLEDSVTWFQRMLSILKQHHLEKTTQYALALMNFAGTYRLMKKYNQALPLFLEALSIYQKDPGNDWYGYASIFNNIALLFQDMGEYDLANTAFQSALEILKKVPQSEIQQATTYNNLATLCLASEKWEEGQSYLEKAISIFENGHEDNPHYGATLNTLGSILAKEHKWEQACEALEKSLVITEKTYGKNMEYLETCRSLALLYEKIGDLAQAEYYRKKGNKKERPPQSITFSATPKDLSLPKQHFGLGLQLAEEYYLVHGKPMIENQFYHYKSRVAVGRAGEGSECFGFDDSLSQDHDWGVGFTIWLTDEDYDVIGSSLQQAYDALPSQFMGYEKLQGVEANNRVGVQRISDFYKRHTLYENGPTTMQEWVTVPEKYLAVATNGAVFQDELGNFSAIRQNLLQFYPEDVRIKKIIKRGLLMSQSGQYNYERSMKRGEYVAASLSLQHFATATLSMLYLLNKKYMPFYKWAYHGVKQLPRLSSIGALVEDLLLKPLDNATNVMTIEQICTDVAEELASQNLITRKDPFLQNHAEELNDLIQDSFVRSFPIIL